MRLQALMRASLRWLPWICSHPRIYTARRPLYGYAVLHFVCPDCGYSSPMVQRTEAEVRAIFETRGGGQ